jgi:hypothetical protein
VLGLVSARARRRPGRWLLSALGIAIAAAFAGAVAVESTIVGDRAARAVLLGLSPLERAVRVTFAGPVTPSVERSARSALSGLGDALERGTPTEVLLVSPVRLGGVLVRPVAVAPLGRWAPKGSATALGPCTARSCPVLAAGGVVPATLAAYGVRFRVAGPARLRSAVPLGFPAGSAGEPPVLLTGDIHGLRSIAALRGAYRTTSWVVPLAAGRLQSWQLAAVQARLARAQAGLAAAGDFTLAAPFDALARARGQASAAPRRLLLAGGGAVAALALFIVLAAGGLRDDQRRELGRLRTAGATVGQRGLFVVAESAWVAGVAVLAGAGAAVVAAAVLAAAAGGVPVGGTLAHGLVTWTVAVVAIGAWIAATAVLVLGTVAGGAGRIADTFAVAAAAALALALAVGAGGGTVLPVLLAPLCALAAGVVVARLAGVALRLAERGARRGPVPVRLALVGLARDRGAPSLAIAFLAVALGLGGFALAYRATLLRGTADQAAYRVPLDATVAPGADFTPPLQLASLARWQALSGGRVLPVRRTQASYVSGAASVTVPALGVPAAGLRMIHGWRASWSAVPPARLGRRLVPAGPARVPGPRLAPGGGSLALAVASPALAVTVLADLRDPSGFVRQVVLRGVRGRSGVGGLRGGAVRVARTPPGAWELEALELDEPSGLQATNGHQNAENPAAATQGAATVRLGPLVVAGSGGGFVGRRVRLGGWRGVGAASVVRGHGGERAGGGVRTSGGDLAGGGELAVVRFAETGVPGIVRPVQPSDRRPVPVLADPQTAAAAGAGGRLELTVDGLPVSARVAGVVRGFPTVGPGAGGVVVADEATLAGALDAPQPGQGRADELWIATGHVDRLRRALASGRFASLDVAFRDALQRRERAAPIARGVLGTLIAAAVVCAVLAVIGLLVALLGPGRDRSVERDLTEQGLGPRGLRAELQLRLAIAAGLGVLAGAGLAVLLTRLAVAGVRAAATGASPQPPLATIVPWGELAAAALAALVVLLVCNRIAGRLALR